MVCCRFVHGSRAATAVGWITAGCMACGRLSAHSPTRLLRDQELWSADIFSFLLTLSLSTIPPDKPVGRMCSATLPAGGPLSSSGRKQVFCSGFHRLSGMAHNSSHWQPGRRLSSRHSPCMQSMIWQLPSLQSGADFKTYWLFTFTNSSSAAMVGLHLVYILSSDILNHNDVTPHFLHCRIHIILLLYSLVTHCMALLDICQF